ncbi:sodium/proton-translocating pyrophosphatase [Candidatus Saccharibacteria bacterium]|nr:sodium/proton-translocating pyrophosphatase [Candidatus Saccharibacteria bacterium]
MNYLLLVYPVIFLAGLFVLKNYGTIRKMPDGTDQMNWVADRVRSGANTFMWTEYTRIIIVVAVVAGMLSLFIDKTSGLTFIVGACMSTMACVFGMNAATYANVKTAETARSTQSVGKTVHAALVGGSVPGLSVHLLGLLGFLVVFFGFGGVQIDSPADGILLSLGNNASITRLTTYSLGCSIVAMFNRVAGGIFTKSADISSDILGKKRHDLREDDPRVPNVIADFIGDLVNDIAGNCSDLLESFVATIVGSIMLAMTAYSPYTTTVAEALHYKATFDATVMFPILAAGGGLLGSLVGLFFISKRELGEEPAKDLDLATSFSAGITVIITVIISLVLFSKKELYPSFRLGWFSPAMAAIFGIGSGIAVGKITEYYTSDTRKPTQKLAKIAPEGTPFLVTLGDALGSNSVFWITLAIVLSTVASLVVAGIYGVAISGLGMLSFVGAMVSIDAFGPIADNAGGIAEAAHLDPKVRIITDKLDATGNTTAAMGKGFAIGSAAQTTSSLILAYIGVMFVGVAVISFNLSALPAILAGMILGGGLIGKFSGMLGADTIMSAAKMADHGDKLMTPDVVSGAKALQDTDYRALVKEGTENAIARMVPPPIIAIVAVFFGGIVFGFGFVAGLLIGATVAAVYQAIFNGNSGGAFDNAKKYWEAKASLGEIDEASKEYVDIHKTVVDGDTIGDTRKDVIGVALDIFIKMMSTAANTLAPIFINYSLFKF